MSALRRAHTMVLQSSGFPVLEGRKSKPCVPESTLMNQHAQIVAVMSTILILLERPLGSCQLTPGEPWGATRRQTRSLFRLWKTYSRNESAAIGPVDKRNLCVEPVGDCFDDWQSEPATLDIGTRD